MSARLRGKGLCLYCQQVAEGVVIAEHDGNSGGGETIICCGDCAQNPRRGELYLERVTGPGATRDWTDATPPS